ncbi:glycoprotein 3-alpha-L-fucosyltransferase A [Nilaparvata lugens]|uniref:glycoprotein 3-alpha-L-fucosyltransferase A n=1 Tax=Nilaparvata lugens TaxID=108931 RepID=UPI00193E7089|nr:glycoprotein 3-alpha-L-fucosyltransferase A [Nilaparvata lugens]XP_039289515.1 glycoprotein 3-alpha-L-fucosyltransferase A [Nilaparvata lugens]
MQEVERDRMNSRSLRGLLYLICCMSVVFIFIVHIDYIPNRVTVFNNLRKFRFTSTSSTEPKQPEERAWFLTNGTRWPEPATVDSVTGRRVAKLWPHEDTTSDRVVEQLMFRPPDTGRELPMKLVYFSGYIEWEVNHPKGSSEPFVTCPVNRCVGTTDASRSLEADAILMKNSFHNPGHHKPAKQLWIMYRLESPVNSEFLLQQNVYNWTATYMRSSDISRPYFKWIYYDETSKEWPGPPRDFAAGKTKKVAWFVTNCYARNNRLQYARELGKHIQVDMYGSCGAEFKCPRSREDGCFKLLEEEYKFYLAFENSNCREYITEKFFKNSLRHKVIPVVMGAPREDYELVAPKDSFIHVEDFDSPKQLAEYLHKVDQDDDLFNSYFKWRDMGEIIEGYFYCRLCAMLHDDYPEKYYKKIDDFWRKPGSCIKNKTWKEYRKSVGGKLPEI